MVLAELKRQDQLLGETLVQVDRDLSTLRQASQGQVAPLVMAQIEVLHGRVKELLQQLQDRPRS
jgi:hypothetical protein